MILEFLSGWVLQIVIFIILAMVVDLILPSSKIKQYAKLVIGLLLILIILQPILSIFKVDVEQLISPVFQPQLIRI